MGRRALTDDEKLAKLLGLDVKSVEVKTSDDQRELSMQAEAVADFLRNPKRYSKRLCWHCEGEFATDYGSVRFCTDQCRKAHLERRGIRWSPEKTRAERWGTTPLIVPPEALEAVCDWVLSQEFDARQYVAP